MYLLVHTYIVNELECLVLEKKVSLVTDCIASFVCQYRNKLRIFVKESFNVQVFLHARKDSIMLPLFALISTTHLSLKPQKLQHVTRSRASRIHSHTQMNKIFLVNFLKFSKWSTGAHRSNQLPEKDLRGQISLISWPLFEVG